MFGSQALDCGFLGEAPEFLSVLRTAQIAAAADVTILVQGESGTGKELLAQSMHRDSRRKANAFVAINCAALPEGLAESELFGHAKGAFTGAVHDYQGRIAGAEGGTLFLDEVGELPLSLQAKLLRFLESGEIHPVGRAKSHKVDVRVIAATNRDLRTEVEAGRFREDLYYRLNVVPIELPPLRNRAGDLKILLKGMTRQLAQSHQIEAPSFTRATIKALEAYNWPGNVRELRNFCERMVVLFAGQTVSVEDLPPEFSFVSNEPKLSFNFEFPECGLDLYEFERSLLSQALEKAKGNQSRAARLLGLSRDTYLYRLKKYAIPA